MRVTRVQLRDFRNYERGRGGPRRRASRWCAGPNGAGKTQPARGALLRLHGPFAAARPTSASWCAAAQSVARVTLDLDGRRRRAPARGRASSRARPSTAGWMAAPVERLASSSARPLVERVHAGPARARQGRARAAAALTSTRSSPRSGQPRADDARPPTRARSRSATRWWGGSAPGRRARTLLDTWDAELARHGIAADGGPPRGARRGCRALFGGWPSELGLPGRVRSCATGRAPRPPTPAGCAAELRRAPRGATSSAASPPTGRTATTSALRPRRRARCARTALRDSSAPRLLALLFAEREPCWRRVAPAAAHAARRRDVGARRRPPGAAWPSSLRSGGQAVVTATEPDHVPGARDADESCVLVEDGRRGGGGGAVTYREPLAPRPGRCPGRWTGAAPATTSRARPGGLGRRSRARRSRAEATPVSERAGVVTVACRSAVWAQTSLELDV